MALPDLLLQPPPDLSLDSRDDILAEAEAAPALQGRGPVLVLDTRQPVSMVSPGTEGKVVGDSQRKEDEDQRKMEQLLTKKRPVGLLKVRSVSHDEGPAVARLAPAVEVLEKCEESSRDQEKAMESAVEELVVEVAVLKEVLQTKTVEKVNQTGTKEVAKDAIEVIAKEAVKSTGKGAPKNAVKDSAVAPKEPVADEDISVEKALEAKEDGSKKPMAKETMVKKILATDDVIKKSLSAEDAVKIPVFKDIVVEENISKKDDGMEVPIKETVDKESLSNEVLSNQSKALKKVESKKPLFKEVPVKKVAKGIEETTLKIKKSSDPFSQALGESDKASKRVKGKGVKDSREVKKGRERTYRDTDSKRARKEEQEEEPPVKTRRISEVSTTEDDKVSEVVQEVPSAEVDHLADIEDKSEVPETLKEQPISKQRETSDTSNVSVDKPEEAMEIVKETEDKVTDTAAVETNNTQPQGSPERVAGDVRIRCGSDYSATSKLKMV